MGNVASAAVMAGTNAAIAGTNLAGQMTMQNNQFDHNKEMAELQQQNNMELMKYASSLQQDNWQHQFDETNEYNSPKNQMELQQQAGLNPLFTGMSQTSSSQLGAAASTPTGSAGLAPNSNTPFQNIPLFGGDFADIYQKMRDTNRADDKHQFEKDKLNAEVQESLSNVQKLHAEGKLTEKEIGAFEEKFNLYKQQILNDTKRVNIDLWNTTINYEKFLWQKKMDAIKNSRENALAESTINLQRHESEYYDMTGSANMLTASANMHRAKTYEQEVKDKMWNYEKQYEIAKKQIDVAIEKNKNDFVLGFLKESKFNYASFTVQEITKVAAGIDAIREYLDKGTINDIKPKGTSLTDYLNQSVHVDQWLNIYQKFANKAAELQEVMSTAIKQGIGWKGSVKESWFQDLQP